MTVFNRLNMTVACLRALEARGAETDADLQVYVFDDGSSDGTVEVLAREFPDVRVLLGDGTFFWNGGMRVVMARARRADPDYVLWINDDTTLEPGAIDVLVRTAEGLGGAEAPIAVCGAITDPDDGSLAYSGVVRPRLMRLRFKQVPPADRPLRVQTMNGNCVLISRAAMGLVGNLDSTYTHGMGDYDYGFRLTRAGGQVWLAPGTTGRCRANPGFVPQRDSVRADLGRLRGVKYLPPAEWGHFVRQWGGPLWPLFWASPYVRQALELIKTRRRG